MTERSFESAATDFFEAFKAYDEAAIGRRIQCLKYLVLANMLMESEVDPFDAQEAKPYKTDRCVLCSCVCFTGNGPAGHSNVTFQCSFAFANFSLFVSLFLFLHPSRKKERD